MPLLQTEADKLSNRDLVRGVIEEIIDRDGLFQLLPFAQTNGKSYDYVRENQLATGDWLNPNDTVNESASTFTEVTTKLRILIGDVDVDKFIDGTESDANPQKALQIAAKAKGMSRQWQQTLITGVTANQEFDGIEALVTAGQTVDAGGNATAAQPLSFADLDELLDAVKLGADVIMMRSGTARAFRALLRLAGGNDGYMMQLENFGRPVMHHNGVPIIINDFIPTKTKTAADATDIYAMRLNEVDGLHGIYGGGPAGVVIEDIGTVQNKDATRTRLKWYTGLALKSTLSLAKLDGVSES